MTINTNYSRPYFLTVIVYLVLALLAIAYTIALPYLRLPFIPNMRWLIVHLVTMGVFTQALFGTLPLVVAGRAGRATPKLRPATWLLLNSGLALLVFGIPTMNFPLINTGGTLIFLAVLWLAYDLIKLRPSKISTRHSRLMTLAGRAAGGFAGLPYYLTGLFFLLIGILVGTGLWQGWAGPLHIATPKEVHVHSNLWGYAAMIFAGLLVDLYPQFTRRSLAWPASAAPIFWLMAAGSMGLVLGPWLDVNLLTVGGLGLHTIGTVWLLINVFKPLAGHRREWSPGIWHLLFASLWFLVAVVVAPFVVARSATGAEVAGNGGPILIYGWMLQISYALVPYLFRRALVPHENPGLGGTWFTLLTINAGSVLYWVSLLQPGSSETLRVLAYSLWFLSALPILVDMLKTPCQGSTPNQLLDSSAGTREQERPLNELGV